MNEPTVVTVANETAMATQIDVQAWSNEEPDTDPVIEPRHHKWSIAAAPLDIRTERKPDAGQTMQSKRNREL